MKIEELLPKMMLGTAHKQYVRCGKTNCRCHKGNPHGPYLYLFWREGGRLRKRYLKRSEVASVRATCEARRKDQQMMKDAWAEFRSIRKAIRGLKMQ